LLLAGVTAKARPMFSRGVGAAAVGSKGGINRLAAAVALSRAGIKAQQRPRPPAAAATKATAASSSSNGDNSLLPVVMVVHMAVTDSNPPADMGRARPRRSRLANKLLVGAAAIVCKAKFTFVFYFKGFFLSSTTCKNEGKVKESEVKLS